MIPFAREFKEIKRKNLEILRINVETDNIYKKYCQATPEEKAKRTVREIQEDFENLKSHYLNQRNIKLLRDFLVKRILEGKNITG